MVLAKYIGLMAPVPSNPCSKQGSSDSHPDSDSSKTNSNPQTVHLPTLH